LDKRPIEDLSPDILSSPADGKILSCSKINSFNELIIVKNTKYDLLNFLYSLSSETHPEFLKFDFENKDFYQITIYLSPGDCHRYFSPNNINISHRIYIPGFLEPVKPSYIYKYQNVLKTNERVTLRCSVENKSEDILFITYVGALNVGSINLNFDDFLKTNQKILKKETQFQLNPYFAVLDFRTVFSNRNNLYQIKNPSSFKFLEEEYEEFDIRDMLNIDFDLIAKYNVDLKKPLPLPYFQFRERLLKEYIFNSKEDLPYTIYNNFMTRSLELFKVQKKLQSPKEMKVEKFNLSNKGLYLNKRDEMGWFNFGSTIVLIFSIDKNKKLHFKHKEGDKVLIGESLYEFI
jgi:phosphatidylserine decarboxylase precursor